MLQFGERWLVHRDRGDADRFGLRENEQQTGTVKEPDGPIQRAVFVFSNSTSMEIQNVRIDFQRTFRFFFSVKTNFLSR